jgi:hypothetical protein
VPARAKLRGMVQPVSMKGLASPENGVAVEKRPTP